MRVLFLFAALWAGAAWASTKPPRNVCNCVLRTKVDGGLVWDRDNCCSAWVKRNTSVSPLKVGGRVYKLVNGSYYRPFSETAGVRMVVFPGLENVMYAADNEYTNWTCAGWWCRPLLVVRNVSSGVGCEVQFDNGDCVVGGASGSLPPLCHNSTASPCVVWAPQPDVTGGPWLGALAGAVALVAVVVLVYSLASEDTCITLFMWLCLLPLSEVTIVAVMRFEEWIAGLRVDRAYVTYQTCLTQCGYAAETNERLAAANQCDDVSSSCTGAASYGRYRMCRSCLSVSDDWVNLVAYALMAKMSVAVAWVALAAYVIVRDKSSRAFCALFVPMLMMVVIYPVMMSRVSVDLLALYSSPIDGQEALMDVGWAWFALLLVWCFLCGLGKVMWAADRRGAQCLAHSSLVFVPV